MGLRGNFRPARVGPVTSIRVTSTLPAVRAADDAGTPLLVLGGGSNVLASDDGFAGVVVRDLRRGVERREAYACAGAFVAVPAGQPWDEVVQTAVDEGWRGVEALSGIPGSTGATPVQNVGAYGQEVAETLETVRVYDRLTQRTRELVVSELGLAALRRIAAPRLARSDADAFDWFSKAAAGA